MKRDLKGIDIDVINWVGIAKYRDHFICLYVLKWLYVYIFLIRISLFDLIVFYLSTFYLLEIIWNKRKLGTRYRNYKKISSTESSQR